MTAPRIYVASLSDYNAGRLVGVWIDATLGAEHIHEQVQRMLPRSPEPGAEEWAIHDHEGFRPWRPGECEAFEKVAAVAQQVEQHGPPFLAYVANDACALDDLDQLGEAFECLFQGEFDDLADYARELLDGQLPEHDLVSRYFDYAAYGRDLHLGGYVWTAEAPEGRLWSSSSEQPACRSAMIRPPAK